MARVIVIGHAQSKTLVTWNNFVETLVSDSDIVIKETLKEFGKRVRARAIMNIEMGAEDSLYPQSGELAASIKFSVKKRKGMYYLEIGSQTDYAALLDSPKGTFTPIWGDPGPMKFFWYKIGKPMRIPRTPASLKRHINYPGKAFLSEAFRDTQPELQEIFNEMVSRYGKK